MRISESTRAAVLDTLRLPLWQGASDTEIALEHGVSPAAVRALRAELRRAAITDEIITRVDDLAVRLTWPGTSAELLLAVLSAADHRASARDYQHPHPYARALREALALERLGEEQPWRETTP